MTEIFYCPNCSTQVFPGEVHGSICGVSLPQRSAEKATEPQPSIVTSRKTLAKPELPVPNQGFTKTRNYSLALIFVICTLILVHFSSLVFPGKIMEMMQTGLSQDSSFSTFCGCIITLYFIVPLLLWVHSARVNLDYLGCKNCAYSPAWAVVYFIIPILNLIKPYFIIEEILRYSDPETDDLGVFKKPNFSWIVATWWFSWVASCLISYLTEQYLISPDNYSGLASKVPLLLSLESALFIISALLLIRIILTISRSQEQKRLKLLAQDQ